MVFWRSFIIQIHLYFGKPLAWPRGNWVWCVCVKGWLTSFDFFIAWHWREGVRVWESPRALGGATCCCFIITASCPAGWHQLGGWWSCTHWMILILCMCQMLLRMSRHSCGWWSACRRWPAFLAGSLSSWTPLHLCHPLPSSMPTVLLQWKKLWIFIFSVFELWVWGCMSWLFLSNHQLEKVCADVAAALLAAVAEDRNWMTTGGVFTVLGASCNSQDRDNNLKNILVG